MRYTDPVKRRGNREGSIYQRPDGRWVAEVMAGYRPDGRPDRRRIYGATRAEVQDGLQKLLRDLRDGLPLPDHRLTVAAYLDQWITGARLRLRPKTWESYEGIIRCHLVPGLGARKLQKLTPAEIERFLAGKLAAMKPVSHSVAQPQRRAAAESKQLSASSADPPAPLHSPRTVAYMRAVLRAALEQARRWGIVNRNAAALASPIAARSRRAAPLTPDQAKAFLAAAAGHRLEALFTVALSLGLRLGEALGLMWSDLDLDAGTLTVRRSVQRTSATPGAPSRQGAAGPKTALHLVEPKTASSVRTIELPAAAVRQLAAHRARQLQERIAAGDRWEERGLVFPALGGGILDQSNARRALRALLKAIGVRARFHDLRHTCATLLLVQGVNPRVVQAILGHSSVRLTLDIYSHLLPGLQRDAMNRLDDLLLETPVAREEKRKVQ